MKKFSPNPVMNGHKSDVPDLTHNEVGARLRHELSELPHAEKDNEIHLTTPVHIKVLSFLIDKGFVWTDHTAAKFLKIALSIVETRVRLIGLWWIINCCDTTDKTRDGDEQDDDGDC